MKKISLLFVLLLFASIFITSCRNDDDPDPPDNGRPGLLTDPGVLIGNINGVSIRWATRNVALHGTFAPYPHSAGMLFQWNRQQAWNNTDAGTPLNWDNTNPLSTPGWAPWTHGMPCPQGWRMPTVAEFEALSNEDSEWVVVNGVNGRRFGSGNNTLFLPAAGMRDSDGVLNSVGTRGSYWSEAMDVVDRAPGEPVPFNPNARYLSISNADPSMNVSARAFGFSVRCVAR